MIDNSSPSSVPGTPEAALFLLTRAEWAGIIACVGYTGIEAAQAVAAGETSAKDVADIAIAARGGLQRALGDKLLQELVEADLSEMLKEKDSATETPAAS